ncbi:AraC family transcriptional regulator [Oceanisphaera sp. KMM 10153]|uniref:AraC family transcriptional regulator n=1 Tax=Oceanisphaera submarina TaxID=3390193 RepID=UPI00397559B4
MIRKEQANYKVSEALNGIEMVDAHYQKQTFSKHVHEGYTIGVIEQGAQRFFRSGENHIADENSIILVNTDDVHTGEAASEGGWHYRAIYPTPEHFALISNDLIGGSSLIPYFRDSVIHDKRIASQLRLIMNQIEEGASVLLVETLIYSTLLALATKHGHTQELPKDIGVNSNKLRLAKELLDAHPEIDVSLEVLATIAGCSKYHFIRQFGKSFNISPHAYQIQVRLIKAKQLLKAGVSIADVSHDCGFHDQSHFTRHFKKALGTTPRQFQLQAISYKN